MVTDIPVLWRDLYELISSNQEDEDASKPDGSKILEQKVWETR